MEKLAKKLIQDGYDTDASASFAERVVDWGKGWRFRDRFLNENKHGKIAVSLMKADNLANSGNPVKAVALLNDELLHLGLSFASKLVRFLAPNHAVIFDSVIRTKLGYPETPNGYQEFLDDCRCIHNSAFKTIPDLRICDIEAAIYMKLQIQKGCS